MLEGNYWDLMVSYRVLLIVSKYNLETAALHNWDYTSISLKYCYKLTPVRCVSSNPVL